jgi:hypothetical protein
LAGAAAAHAGGAAGGVEAGAEKRLINGHLLYRVPERIRERG